MNEEAAAWLDKAREDLRAAESLFEDTVLAGVVAFHAQQAVEKALKSVIIVQHNKLVRTHDLKRLFADVNGIALDSNDEWTLAELTTLYTASRYPGDLGLLPSGEPTTEDLKRFLALAEKVVGESAILIER